MELEAKALELKKTKAHRELLIRPIYWRWIEKEKI